MSEHLSIGSNAATCAFEAGWRTWLRKAPLIRNDRAQVQELDWLVANKCQCALAEASKRSDGAPLEAEVLHRAPELTRDRGTDWLGCSCALHSGFNTTFSQDQIDSLVAGYWSLRYFVSVTAIELCHCQLKSVPRQR